MELDRFSQSLVALTQAVATPNFYPACQQLFESFLDYDELLVIHFHREQAPSLLFQHSKNAHSANDLVQRNEWNYLTNLYVLDPFYRAYIDDNYSGFLRLSDSGPDQFETIYNLYFNYLKLSDEVGFLLPLEDGSCIHIDLSRFSPAESFGVRTCAYLSQLVNVLAELFAEHIRATPKQQDEKQNHVEQLLQNFGKDVLTNKEYQVMQLLLRGHSTKAIAANMGIGTETVKMHRKNIYGKTFTVGQPEILALFIEILQSEDLDPGQDQLHRYLQRQ
ncbi:helix-turn-helix transcriptional regulator [Thalassotalea sp. PS06]|uniref:helix-turn-helix transcriptional regulator n=1 Tax=Thalassotalea sp. PS06 TaxID=2594005 RepID=UPI0011658FFA|nr:helix-turn-helix transcriptional regulator [Thalassotalea sp. PS06]QDP00110.1 helix-turn-helix transcriptional regulator [Thalassotalea sp. PS06]